MVKKCILCGALFDNNLGISFHRFPRDRATRQKWLKVCRITEKAILSSSSVCARHFHAGDFDKVYWPKKRLLPNVVPSRAVLRRFSHPSISNSNNEIVALSSQSPSDIAHDPLKEEFIESSPIFESDFETDPLKPQLKIIEVFSEASSVSGSVHRRNTFKEEIVDDDIEIIDDCYDDFPTPNSSKKGIKIIEVFSEAPLVHKSVSESDEDVEIIEDSPEVTPRSGLSPVKYTYEPKKYTYEPKKYTYEPKKSKTEEHINFNSFDFSNQVQYVNNLTVKHFSTPKKTQQSLEFVKTTVGKLNNKVIKNDAVNQGLITKIRCYRNVLLYLRNNNLILDENAITMVNKLL